MTMQAENTTARHTMARPPPLLDLLGASFVFNTPIKALVWDGASVCLGLADGAIAMLFAQWPGGPALGHRPSGGVEIMAGEAPPPPPRILAAHRGAVSSLARIGSGGIVSGGADGRFLRITEGIIETIADQPRKTVSHVAAGRGGRCAMVAGHQVDLFGADARRIAVSGAVKALAYDPSGLNLAISHADGVVIATDGVRRLRPAGPAGAIAWNSDGTMFAIATPDGEITITRIDMTTRPHRITPRGAPTALCFTTNGDLIVVEDGTILWMSDLAALPATCLVNAAPITALASHPHRPVVACGDGAGGIFLCQPGVSGRMTIRDDGAAITHLAYAPDGEALAFAAADNEAGVVALPDLLFRTERHP